MGFPIIGELVNGVRDLISEAVVDKDKKLQIELELARLADQAQARVDDALKANIEVNKVEAASGNVFVSGWRPFVGWVGGFSLAYAAILEPLFRFGAVTLFGYKGLFPIIDTDITLQVLMGMLGLGAMRSYEKKNGVASNSFETKEVSEEATTEEPVKKKKKKFRIF